MKSKYNIALIPTKFSNKIIELANELKDIADRYVLGTKSLPHVTIYQFDANEENIDKIWSSVLRSLDQTSIHLVFEKFSCITFDNKTFWASLLPSNLDFLMDMHSKVATAINLPVKTNYDPHMTLINSINKDYEKFVNDLSASYKTVEDTFVLSLGKSDAIGQYTEVILTAEIIMKSYVNSNCYENAIYIKPDTDGLFCA